LAAREAQIDAIYNSGLDLVTQSGGGSQSGGSYTSAGEGAINQRMREASGAGEVQARIARLREILAAREDE